MDNRRKSKDTLSYVMIGTLFIMFCMVLLALIKGDVKSDYGALVGGFGTTILGMFAVAVGFLWGSSKGSQLKDEAMLKKGDRNAEIDAGGGVTGGSGGAASATFTISGGGGAGSSPSP